MASLCWDWDSRYIWHQSLRLQPVSQATSIPVMCELTSSPFLCSGACEEEDTWRLVSPSRNASASLSPLCICDSVYATACDLCESCPAATYFRRAHQLHGRHRSLWGQTMFCFWTVSFSSSSYDRPRALWPLDQPGPNNKDPSGNPSGVALNSHRKVSLCQMVHTLSLHEEGPGLLLKSSQFSPAGYGQAPLCIEA